MIVIDSSVFIEYFKGRQPFVARVEELIRQNQVAGCEIVFAELLQGALNKKECNFLESFFENLPSYDLTQIVFKAGKLSFEKQFIAKGIGLVDTIIVAYARTYNLQIWTLDKKLISVLRESEIFA